MGWFHSSIRSPSAQPLYSVVSVLRGKDGKSAGAGVLLAPTTLLTCAHVVNDALQRPMFDDREPSGERVKVTLHRPHEVTRTWAAVTHWLPPRRRVPGGPGAASRLPVRPLQDAEWLGDLAVLEIEAADGEVHVPQWAPMAEGQMLRAWHGSARSSTYADVRVGPCDGEIGYMDGWPTGMAIGPAYSGGPLWSTMHNAVVGLVCAHVGPPTDAAGRPLPYTPQHIARRSWGIPWQRITEELRAAGAGHLFDPPEADADDPAAGLLCSLLKSLLPSGVRRADYARAVAGRCGYGYPEGASSPSPEEFAAFLVTEPRALAALSEVLRRNEPHAAEQLLAVGWLSRVPRLLAPREYRRLHDVLATVPAAALARLPEAVRAALPRTASFPVEEVAGHLGRDTSDVSGTGTAQALDALLDHLEYLPGDSRSERGGPRVPALLTAVEYFSALCPPAQRAHLRLWSDGVAERLAVPRQAMTERRSVAAGWHQTQDRARAQGTVPRVLAQIGLEAGDRYRLRVWCDEGSGLRQVSTEGDVTYSATEAARVLLRAVESLYRTAPVESRPVVEALVDRGALNLPIDEWESVGPDDVVPEVLGVGYPLVVNCPDLRRKERFLHDWRDRWRKLDTGHTLRLDDAAVGVREVYAMLLDRTDTVRVAVDVPQALREAIVQTCLSVGVPVVVWDRQADDGGSHAVREMTAVTTRKLPEEVRTYRAKSVHRPQEFTGRPVLAWADADRTVPQLHLSEPQEGP
ncbi:trypsin-like peptidase domain-containing protein [Streptomyces sp. NPDC048644]|uniref:VMAP-C domain-containing protein n=1 Tax=Streptomyces sp. NPDC048644 TaxID=3365582 RepID=UPI0037157E3B